MHGHKHGWRQVWRDFFTTLHTILASYYTIVCTCVLLTFFVFFKPFQTSSVTVNKAVIGLETSHFCLTNSPHRPVRTRGAGSGCRLPPPDFDRNKSNTFVFKMPGITILTPQIFRPSYGLKHLTFVLPTPLSPHRNDAMVSENKSICCPMDCEVSLSFFFFLQF